MKSVYCFFANVQGKCSPELNVTLRMFICRYLLHCSLYADGTLKWLGYSVSGVLASFDSAGVLRVAPSTNRNHWVPVLNTSKVRILLKYATAFCLLYVGRCFKAKWLFHGIIQIL